MSKRITGLMLSVVLAASGAIALAAVQSPPKADDDQGAGEQERKVTEADVPKAALDALKKLAGGAAFTEFAEEVEHGHKFYEGSWKGSDGNVDALVTESGDLVELEEMIPAGKAAAAAREAAQKEAGKDAKLTLERKTMILYEAHWTKDGKEHEMLVTPDGRPFHEDGGAKGEDDDDDKKGGNEGKEDEDD